MALLRSQKSVLYVKVVEGLKNEYENKLQNAIINAGTTPARRRELKRRISLTKK
jgi:uncharacterized protein YeeX (DUF496 family)